MVLAWIPLYSTSLAGSTVFLLCVLLPPRQHSWYSGSLVLLATVVLFDRIQSLSHRPFQTMMVHASLRKPQVDERPHGRDQQPANQAGL